MWPPLGSRRDEGAACRRGRGAASGSSARIRPRSAASSRATAVKDVGSRPALDQEAGDRRVEDPRTGAGCSRGPRRELRYSRPGRSGARPTSGVPAKWRGVSPSPPGALTSPGSASRSARSTSVRPWGGGGPDVPAGPSPRSRSTVSGLAESSAEKPPAHHFERPLGSAPWRTRTGRRRAASGWCAARTTGGGVEGEQGLVQPPSQGGASAQEPVERVGVARARRNP